MVQGKKSLSIALSAALAITTFWPASTIALAAGIAGVGGAGHTGWTPPFAMASPNTIVSMQQFFNTPMGLGLIRSLPSLNALKTFKTDSDMHRLAVGALEAHITEMDGYASAENFKAAYEKAAADVEAAFQARAKQIAEDVVRGRMDLNGLSAAAENIENHEAQFAFYSGNVGTSVKTVTDMMHVARSEKTMQKAQALASKFLNSKSLDSGLDVAAKVTVLASAQTGDIRPNLLQRFDPRSLILSTKKEMPNPVHVDRTLDQSWARVWDIRLFPAGVSQSNIVAAGSDNGFWNKLKMWTVERTQTKSATIAEHLAETERHVDLGVVSLNISKRINRFNRELRRAESLLALLVSRSNQTSSDATRSTAALRELAAISKYLKGAKYSIRSDKEFYSLLARIQRIVIASKDTRVNRAALELFSQGLEEDRSSDYHYRSYYTTGIRPNKSNEKLFSATLAAIVTITRNSADPEVKKYALSLFQERWKEYYTTSSSYPDYAMLGISASAENGQQFLMLLKAVHEIALSTDDNQVKSAALALFHEEAVRSRDGFDNRRTGIVASSRLKPQFGALLNAISAIAKSTDDAKVKKQALALFKKRSDYNYERSMETPLGILADSKDTEGFLQQLEAIKDIALSAKDDDIKTEALDLFREESIRNSRSYDALHTGLVASSNLQPQFDILLKTIASIAESSQSSAVKMRALTLFERRYDYNHEFHQTASLGIVASGKNELGFLGQLATIKQIALSTNDPDVKKQALGLFMEKSVRLGPSEDDRRTGLVASPAAKAQFEALVKTIAEIAAGSESREIKRLALSLFEKRHERNYSRMRIHTLGIVDAKDQIETMRAIAGQDKELIEYARRVEESWAQKADESDLYGGYAPRLPIMPSPSSRSFSSGRSVGARGSGGRDASDFMVATDMMRPFWEREEALSRMHPRDAAFWAENSFGLPSWTRDRFSSKGRNRR